MTQVTHLSAYSFLYLAASEGESEKEHRKDIEDLPIRNNKKSPTLSKLIGHFTVVCLRDLVFEYKQGWSCLCLDTNLTAFHMNIMLLLC